MNNVIKFCPFCEKGVTLTEDGYCKDCGNHAEKMDKYTPFLMDYETEVKKIFPHATIISMVGGVPNQPVDKTKYHIQKDGRMKFMECEEDEDFLTDTGKTYFSEEEAWQYAYTAFLRTKMKSVRPDNERQVQPVLTTSPGMEPPYQAEYKRHLQLTAFGFPPDLRENDFQAGWNANPNKFTPEDIEAMLNQFTDDAPADYIKREIRKKLYPKQ